MIEDSDYSAAPDSQ